MEIFGSLKIAGDEENEIKYCKVNQKSKIERILTNWGLKRTGLLLSLTGTTFPDKDKQKEIVKALAEVLASTGAWVISDAIDDVGNILKEAVLEVEAINDYKPVIIGVFRWETFGQKYCKMNRVPQEDKHFTHFIFVDDGIGFDEYRVKLDSTISSSAFGSVGAKIPVVVLNICNDVNNKYLELSVENDHPVLSFGDSKSKMQLTDENMKGKEHLVSYITSANSIEYAYAILKSVIGTNDKSIDILRLSIVWNESHDQVASLVKKSSHWNDETYKHKLLKFALESNNGKTTPTLVSSGIDLATFCQNNLVRLFSKIGDAGCGVDTLGDVQDYVMHETDVLLDIANGVKTNEIAIICLFIWSIFSMRYDVSYQLWRLSENKMTAAVFACKCLERMKKCTGNEDRKTRIEWMIGKYDHRSTWILTKCYADKKNKAKKCLVRERKEFGGTSTLLMANQNKVFIQNNACQAALNDIWLEPLSTDETSNPFWKIMLFMVNPLLAGFFLNFENLDSKKDGNEKCYGAWRLKRARDFMKSTLVKFMYDMLSFLVFLTIFAYAIVFSTNQALSAVNYALMVWVFTFAIEEIRQLFVSNGDYFTDIWNWIDLLAFVMFVVGEVLCHINLEIARIIMALDFIVYSLRLLHACTCLRNIGPKLVMIGKMMQDLVYFLIIMMIVVVSYAIATQSILYPNSPVTWYTFYKTLKIPYWNIFGELGLEDIEDVVNCTNDTMAGFDGLPRCPTKIGTYIVPIMMAIYMLIVHVLLLNLLIAMFSFTFEKVQVENDKHWCFLRYKLIREYYDRPFLCPPLMLISHVTRFVFYLRRKLGKKQSRSSNAFCTHVDKTESDRLMRWERMHAERAKLNKKDLTHLEESSLSGTYTEIRRNLLIDI
ncbi:transient receptor potential cation channel subfamily M member 2-like [Mya arenaria]|uniref:transient receptor potential cation channel subfamily M member 2-like n=1 Tax=Mya arenaria TaxID=6604 RepID=UPI0022DF063F|nr:transient receptor potential cation channel subfamily M member 2-like [Mya arenaria]